MRKVKHQGFQRPEKTVAAIKDIEDLHGSVTVEINGDSYTGALEHDHDEHDHEGEAGHEH
ncbi:MAG: hypothetical protein R3C02_02530 [Planctomycetaceae bacterium]